MIISRIGNYIYAKIFYKKFKMSTNGNPFRWGDVVYAHATGTRNVVLGYKDLGEGHYEYTMSFKY